MFPFARLVPSVFFKNSRRKPSTLLHPPTAPESGATLSITTDLSVLPLVSLPCVYTELDETKLISFCFFGALSNSRLLVGTHQILTYKTMKNACSSSLLRAKTELDVEVQLSQILPFVSLKVNNHLVSQSNFIMWPGPS